MRATKGFRKDVTRHSVLWSKPRTIILVQIIQSGDRAGKPWSKLNLVNVNVKHDQMV